MSVHDNQFAVGYDFEHVFPPEKHNFRCNIKVAEQSIIVAHKLET